MCGIFASISAERPAGITLWEGISRLDHRGQDSFGLVTLSEDRTFHAHHELGRPERRPDLEVLPGTIGLAHTRWATTGTVRLENAHPLAGGRRNISCYAVHNGVITNWREIRQELEGEKYHFRGDTDSEVIPHLFDWLCRQHPDWESLRLLHALADRLEGQYALVLVSRFFPRRLHFALHGAPLLGGRRGYLASDPTPLRPLVRKVQVFPDPCRGIVLTNGMTHVYSPEGNDLPITDVSLEEVEGSLPAPGQTFYEKEWSETPARVEELSRRTFSFPEVGVGGCRFLACGSSYHAACLGQAMLEQVSVPCQVEYAHQVRTFLPDCLTLAITQSGETRDVLQAIERVGASRVITNTPSSTAARRVFPLLLEAGEERSVAATRTFTLTAALIYRMVCQWTGRTSRLNDLACALALLVENPEGLIRLGRRLAGWKGVLLAGQGISLPAAGEGALKLMEVAGLHTTALPAPEIKHGPLTLIGNGVGILALAGCAGEWGRVQPVLEEVRARRGEVALVGIQGVIPPGEGVVLPSVSDPLLEGLVLTFALQGVALHAGLARGLAVDRPRHLAKTITV